MILVLALLTNLFTLRIRKLPVGRAWEALREDETACRALGIDPSNTKLTAFAIGAMFAGFAGSFFAARQGFISPESFTFIETAMILAIVVLGGMGSQIGVVLAAVLLIGGFETAARARFPARGDVGRHRRDRDLHGRVRLRRRARAPRRRPDRAGVDRRVAGAAHLPAAAGARSSQPFGMPGFDPAQYRGLLFGLAMVVMMVVRPRGFVSTRSPSIFLKERKAVSGDLVKEGHG